MKIYFAGSITGGRNDAMKYVKIIENLKKFGIVLTEHIADLALDERGNSVSKSPEVIYAEDKAWIDESDVMIAEVTQPSLGVGWELGYAQATKKRTICLFNSSSGRTLSAMIRGNDFYNIFDYDDLDEVFMFLKKELG